MASKIGSPTKGEYTHKESGITFPCLSLEAYDKLEERMKRDVIERALEAMELVLPSDPETKRTVISEAMKRAEDINLNTSEGIKLLSSGRYQKFIVELSLVETSSQLTAEDCRKSVNDMRYKDIKSIACQLLMRDNIYANIDDPNFIQNLIDKSTEELKGEAAKLSDYLDNIKDGENLKKNASTQDEDDTQTEASVN